MNELPKAADEQSIIMVGIQNPERSDNELFESGELDFRDITIKKPNL